MVILLCYTSAFSEVIYADFYAKILDWNFGLVDENSQILVLVFVSNFNFSFRFVDENCWIFVVVVFVRKINLFSSTKIFVFVVVDEKNTGLHDSSSFSMLQQLRVLYIKYQHNIHTMDRKHFYSTGIHSDKKESNCSQSCLLIWLSLQ